MKNKKVNFKNIKKILLRQQECIKKYMEKQDCFDSELETLFIRNIELMTDIIEIEEKIKKER